MTKSTFVSDQDTIRSRPETRNVSSPWPGCPFMTALCHGWASRASTNRVPFPNANHPGSPASAGHGPGAPFMTALCHGWASRAITNRVPFPTRTTGIPSERRPWPGCPIHDGFMSWVGFARHHELRSVPNANHPGSPASAGHVPGAPFMTALCHGWASRTITNPPSVLQCEPGSPASAGHVPGAPFMTALCHGGASRQHEPRSVPNANHPGSQRAHLPTGW